LSLIQAWRQSTPSVRSILDRFQFWFTVTLDSGLKDNLNKTEQFLRLKFTDFSDRYDSYCKIDPQISEVLEKYDHYLILKNLDRDNQDKIVLLSVLLYCWENARKSHKNLLQDVNKSIYRSINVNRVPGMLRDYYMALLKAMFDTSRAFKLGNTQSMKLLLADGIKVLRGEVQGLRTTVNSYRDFISLTYPAQSNDLIRLSYDLQSLDASYARMNQSLEYSQDPEQTPYHASLQKEIDGLLHSMGQPLTSRKVMRSQVHQLLPLLQDCDELGSHDERVTEFMGETLTKALRVDWKTQLLEESPSFHDLIFQHLGIVGPIEDRAHINRYGKFKRIIQHIEHWVREGKTYRHIDEIEVDMNDIKEVLQDYLATVQRLVKEGIVGDKGQLTERSHKLSQMLLEYRYLFGNFYSFLRKHSSEGEYIRNQFQYIERYFEAVEHQLKTFQNETSQG